MVKRPEDISWQSCFRNDSVPDLALSSDLALPLRVYVLRCAGNCWYVGLAPKHKVQDRIAQQFEADVSKGSSQYCQAHAPSSVACVWPVAAHAMEAAFFYAMQEALCITDFRRLGGWVYTSSGPSPLDVMRLTQTKRQLSNKCFNCGQGHHANSARCPGSNAHCFYECLQCKARHNVSSRGQSTLQSCGSAASSSSTRERARPAPAAHALPEATFASAPAAPKRGASGTGVPTLPVAKRVRVCGHSYTTLAWYLNAQFPGKTARETAQEKCLNKAVEMRGGDSKTLVAKDFARKPPQLGKELLPERANLPSSWTDTECASVLHSRAKNVPAQAFLQVRRATGASGCRGVLFRVDDLQKAMPK